MYTLLVVLTYNRGYWGGYQVSNVAIYYKMSSGQSQNEVVSEVEELIKEIDSEILGVYIDLGDTAENFFSLIEEELSNIDYLYINNRFEDDFTHQLINELARNANFKIIYFKDLI